MKTFFSRTLTVFVLFIGLVLIAGCSIDGPKPSEAGRITLAWDANTEENLKGYKLHYGLESGAYTRTVDVGRATSYTVSGLDGGSEYFFALSAYANDGSESSLSEEVGYSPASY